MDQGRRGVGAGRDGGDIRVGASGNLVVALQVASGASRCAGSAKQTERSSLLQPKCQWESSRLKINLETISYTSNSAGALANLESAAGQLPASALREHRNLLGRSCHSDAGDERNEESLGDLHFQRRVLGKDCGWKLQVTRSQKKM